MSRPRAAAPGRGSRSGVGSWPGRSAPGRVERGERRDPGETEVANDLPRNGPSGTYSQAWMSRARPVVEADDAEDVVGERVDGDPVAERGAGADHEAQLGLDVEPPARAVRRGVVGRRLALAARPDDRRTADDDGAGAAVVADGQVPPVGQQRLLVGPEDPADVGGVVERGVEVDVVADLERQVQGDLGRAGPGAARRGRARSRSVSRPVTQVVGPRPRGPAAMKRVEGRARAQRRASRPRHGGERRAPCRRCRTPTRGVARRRRRRRRTAGGRVEAEARRPRPRWHRRCLQQSEADQVVERLGDAARAERREPAAGAGEVGAAGPGRPGRWRSGRRGPRRPRPACRRRRRAGWPAGR